MSKKRPPHETFTLIAILRASGIREFEWKERVLRDLMQHKK